MMTNTFFYLTTPNPAIAGFPPSLSKPGLRLKKGGELLAALNALILNIFCNKFSRISFFFFS
jgi:hypothetical protein